MAEKSSDKMAVTSDNQMVNHTVKDIVPRDDESKLLGIQKLNVDLIPKKKSTFKITSVTKVSQRGGSGGDPLTDADGDSMDDLDESHTEDASSEIFDSSKTTDLDQDTPSEDITRNLTPDPDVAMKEKSDILMHSRFKVVKIDTKLRRGRWTCYDFQATDKADTKAADDSSSGNSSTPNSFHFVYGVDDPSKNPLFLATSTDGILQPVECFQPIQPAPVAQSGTGTILISGQAQAQWNETQPGTPQQSQILHTTHSSSTNIQQTTSQQNLSQNVLNQNAAQSVLQPPKQSGQENQSLPQNQSSQTGSNAQNQTLSIQQGQTPMQNAEGLSQTVGSSTINVPVTSQTHVQDTSTQIATSLVNQSQVHNTLIDNIPLASTQPSQSTQTGVGQAQTSQTFVLTQPVVTDTSKSQTSSSTLGGQNVQADFIQQDNSQTSAKNVEPSKSVPEMAADQTTADGSTTLFTLNTDSLQKGLTDMKDADIQSAAALLTPLEVAVSSHSKENENKSGSSSVAIDNKIEQAMDLVKSHLMYAVREEVEVLKEQIKELIEKNNQLEYENSILKAAASQETLATLSQPRPQQPSSSTS